MKRHFTFLSAALLFFLFLSPTLISAQDPEPTPTNWGLVDVGSYSLFIDCQGTGDLTVILESGLGQNTFVWEDVQTELAKTVRVCAYDRAGVGHSDLSPITPRTSRAMADELYTLLTNAHLPGPYVLVGVGFGGFTVRLFTSAHPEDVIGLVLVENDHEDFDQHIAESFNEIDRSQFWDVVEDVTWENYQTSQEEVREARIESSSDPVLGDRPLVVMTAVHEGLLTDESDEQEIAFMELWLDLQAELTALSTNSQFVRVEESGHQIHEDRPDVVIEAVQWVIEQAASSESAQ